jgi:tetrahydromethanopterin S-methyltransferase subunit G
MNEYSEPDFQELLLQSNIWDENQLSLRNEAHQRATLRCDPPAIVWHAATWPERKLDPQNSLTFKEHNNRLKDWLDRVNALVAILGGTEKFRLHNGISPEQAKGPSKQIEKNISPDNWIQSVEPRSMEFLTEWRHTLIQTRVQIFNDFLTVTFVLSFPEALPSYVNSSDQTIIDKFRTSVRHATSPDAEEARNSSQFLFVQAWDQFSNDLVQKAQNTQKEMQIDDPISSLVPGNLFLSLRGVVLNVNQSQPEFDKDTNIREFQRKILEKHENFITVGGFAEDDRDFVAASMLHDRAIFVSPLGAKSSKDPNDRPDSKTPRRVTRFTIVSLEKTNSHEMGRVVAKITALCTFQIVAIKDINLIRQVGTQIRLAGDKLNQFSIRFSKAIERLGRPPNNLEVELCKFETELDELSRLPTGGLAYRVYRSQYYVREFKRRLESLKFGELDYWQSPQSFFEKRLFAVFDYIQTVGQRMRNLRRRLYETLEAVQTKTLVDLTSRVHKIHRTSQIQSLILFLIAVSAFCGEIFEPLFQVARNYPESFRSLLEILSVRGLLFEVPEVYRSCLPLEPVPPDVRATLNLFAPDGAQREGQEVCRPVFRVLGYFYGLLIGLLAALVYTIFAPVFRGAARFVQNFCSNFLERVRLRR